MCFELSKKQILLTEGQKLKWFTKDEAKQTHLAYGFNEIVEMFYNQVPFFDCQVLPGEDDLTVIKIKNCLT